MKHTYTGEEKETMEEKLEPIIIDIPNGYEFFGINDDNKVVLTKKQPQYPKTYEECCEVFEDNFFNVICLSKNEKELYYNIIKLKRCRDAYWKLAGKEMGLDKPWKPKHEYDEEIFFIYCDRVNGINKGQGFPTDNFCLSFPTEEMRDAFFENFKELIEQCKRLL